MTLMRRTVRQQVQRDARRRSRVFPAALLLGLAAGLLAAPARAVDDREILVLGQPVVPAAGTYLVTKDLNVRALPDTKGKKVGRFEEGDRIVVVGKAKGSWMAVEKGGEAFGFVYAPVLVPLLDGVVREPLSGEIQLTSGQCRYRMVFDGQTAIEGQRFGSFDYLASLECRLGARSFSFDAPLFISEGPFNGGRRPIHQIGIDILELAQDYDRFFSTSLLYDRGKSQVRFDTISVKKYRKKQLPEPLPASTPATALAAGLALGLQSWSAAFWDDLAKALKAE